MLSAGWKRYILVALEGVVVPSPARLFGGFLRRRGARCRWLRRFRRMVGLVLLLLPAAGFLTGALFASVATELPPMLRAYPLGITIRFGLAAATAFALAFGIQYGLGRRASRVILVSVAVIGATEVLGQLFFSVSPTAPMWHALGSEASPLRIFAANWMLFDV